MITLRQASEHLGHGVVYRPAHGPAEDGTIVWVSDRFVFVRYGSDTGSKATDPAFLDFLASAP